MTLSRVDFLRRPARSVVGYWVLAVGVLALGAALSHTERSRAERELHRAERAQRDAAERADAEAVRPRAPSADERRWQQAQRELQHPWLATLRAVEQATQPPVFLLSMLIDPSTGVVRLDAEASNFEQAMAYAQALGATGALESTVPSSHETATDPSHGRPGVRFAVTTRWRP